MGTKKVADALSDVLADSYVLFAKTQNYHWNVVGPDFPGLHALFQTQYEELFLAVDEVAERIRQLGFKTPGTLGGFLKATVLSEGEATNAPGMVADLAACHEKLAARAQTAIKVADEAGDEGSLDLMVARRKAHDKTAWMLRATLGEEAGTASGRSSATAAVTKASKSTVKVVTKARPKAEKKVKEKKSTVAKAVPDAKKAAPVKAAKPAAASGKKKVRQAMG
ncbi:MAG: DNA starvation/stationary phase protection protein [Armatimonadetes bacterium]|nr:DNA starvation/stationary phase protection protein [Armatimonadota bacterium]